MMSLAEKVIQNTITRARRSVHQTSFLGTLVQAVTGETVTLAFVDQGYTGDAVREAAAHGIVLTVIKQLPEAKRSFVLLPRRWVVERSFAWASRFRRLARDYGRLLETVAGSHLMALTCLMPHRMLTLAAQSP